MGVVTWKNIAPTNPAGILSSANQAAKGIAEGFAGVGEAATEFSDAKTKRETDDFVADLMTADTQAERDYMIEQANTGWLNLETINATNYELGQPDRDLEVALATEGRAQETWEDQLEAQEKADKLAYTQQKADDFLYSQQMEEHIYKPRAELLAAAALAKSEAEAKAKKDEASKKLYVNYGDDPTAFLKEKYGFFEGGIWSGLNPTGPAMGMDDLADLDWWGGKFGSEYDRKAFNDFVVRGGIMFDDQIGGRDTFYFIDTSGNVVEMRRSYSKEKAQLLYDAMLSYKGDTSANLAQQGGFFQTLDLHAKETYPDLYKLIDDPDTPKNEFVDLFATLSDAQKSSTGLSEAFLKAYIADNDITKKDNQVDLVHKSKASQEIQSEAKGIVMSMKKAEMDLKVGELLLLDDPSELQSELLRQLLLKTEK